MNWIIPGTTLEDRRSNADQIDNLFTSMFLAGGLTLSQVSSVTGLESHTIQNWVKRGFLSPPRGKRYDMEQVCRIINMNLLKGCLPLEQICSLMTYLNGCLSDESDDLVDDTMLYFMFVRLSARARHIGGSKDWDEALLEITEEYHEPVPGARDKLVKVLKIMLTVWVANTLRTTAEKMIDELECRTWSCLCVVPDRPLQSEKILCIKETKQWKKTELTAGPLISPQKSKRKSRISSASAKPQWYFSSLR